MLRGENHPCPDGPHDHPPDGSQHDHPPVCLSYGWGGAGGGRSPMPGVAEGLMKVHGGVPVRWLRRAAPQGPFQGPRRRVSPATRSPSRSRSPGSPWISLVWAGFYVLMAGAILALVKRTREARKAVLAAEAEPSREISGLDSGCREPGDRPYPLPALSHTTLPISERIVHLPYHYG